MLYSRWRHARSAWLSEKDCSRTSWSSCRMWRTACTQPASTRAAVCSRARSRDESDRCMATHTGMKMSMLILLQKPFGVIISRGLSRMPPLSVAPSSVAMVLRAEPSDTNTRTGSRNTLSTRMSLSFVGCWLWGRWAQRKTQPIRLIASRFVLSSLLLVSTSTSRPTRGTSSSSMDENTSELHSSVDVPLHSGPGRAGHHFRQQMEGHAA
mmetsp:Transcript_2172/g.5866  ORF Transcript_2172/g.5866 Transcript_2172/m.5866 type:complete len:210 (+) Transcript_2172:625-1254(+)